MQFSGLFDTVCKVSFSLFGYYHKTCLEGVVKLPSYYVGINLQLFNQLIKVVEITHVYQIIDGVFMFCW